MADSDDELIIHSDDLETTTRRRTRRDHSMSPRRASSRERAEAPSAQVEELVKALMAGGLMQSVERAARQQVALVMNKITDSVDLGPSSSRASTRGESLSTEPAGGRLLGSEGVDRFDPDDADVNIGWWLQKIDQLGSIYGWTDCERMTLAQSKLLGEARRWSRRLEDYDLRWDEWKMELRLASIKRNDFCKLLEELVSRRKSSTETMTNYYHEKLELCHRVKINGEEAVSCIIGGLPENLQVHAYLANCATPEELYNTFLAGVEGYTGELKAKPNVPTRGERGSESKRETASGRKRCYNCQRITDHISRNCPLPPANRCKMCGVAGHIMADCPRRRPEDGAGRKNQNGRKSKQKRTGEQSGRASAVRGRFR